MAPRLGIGPRTPRLTVACSTAELPRHMEVPNTVFVALRNHCRPPSIWMVSGLVVWTESTGNPFSIGREGEARTRTQTFPVPKTGGLPITLLPYMRRKVPFLYYKPFGHSLPRCTNQTTIGYPVCSVCIVTFFRWWNREVPTLHTLDFQSSA